MQHRLIAVEDTEDGRGVVWKCDDCGRWLIVHRDAGLTVVNQGDFFAQHSGWRGPPGTLRIGVEPVEGAGG